MQKQTHNTRTLFFFILDAAHGNSKINGNIKYCANLVNTVNAKPNIDKNNAITTLHLITSDAFLCDLLYAYIIIKYAIAFFITSITTPIFTEA